MAGKGLTGISSLVMAMSVALAGVPAGQAAGAAELKADSAKKDKSKRVCRSIVRAGTRLAIRRCLSQEEWDAAEKSHQDGVFRLQRDHTVPNPGPN